MNILIVDGSNLLHRGYHAITSQHQKYAANHGSDEENPLDVPVAVFILSFLQSLKSYVTEFDASDIYVAWDKKLVHPSTNFRKESKTVAYKAQRDPEMSKKVFATEEALTPILTSLGVKVMFPRVMEADDVIAWLAHKYNHDNVTVVSVDKDLAQLVTHNCSVYNPIKKILITPSNFENVMGVPQDRYILYKAIVGDASDNIDGLSGYGPAKGKKLALSYETADIPTESRVLVESFIKLIDLSYGYTVHPEEVPAYEEQIAKLVTLTPNFDKFIELVETHKLPYIKNQIDKWRGVFGRTIRKNVKVGNTPINDILKNLFS